jgi:hypothetical protein
MRDVAELFGRQVRMAIELDGAVAQLGEHLLCKQGVSGSIPLSSTIFCPDAVAPLALRSGRAGQRWPTASGLYGWIATEFVF